MYLIIGATGMVGGEISHLLSGEQQPVRGLIRTTSDQAKVDQLKASGVEVIQGNLRDYASLQAACKGVSAVISTASSMPFSYTPGDNDIRNVDSEGLKNLIRAAKAAGVKHFIYTSFSGNMDLDFPLRNAKRSVEKYLQESGLNYTILRPSYFTEAWLSPVVGFDASNAKAMIYGSGKNPISWISYLDVAKFAVASLTNPKAHNATLELGGPEALSPLEVVRIFEKVGRKTFEVQFVPEEALEAQQKAASDPMQQSFTGLMRCYAQGDPIDMQETLRSFPIKLSSVEDYAQRVLAPA